jgi:hypothetical protein
MPIHYVFRLESERQSNVAEHAHWKFLKVIVVLKLTTQTAFTLRYRTRDWPTHTMDRKEQVHFIRVLDKRVSLIRCEEG